MRTHAWQLFSHMQGLVEASHEAKSLGSPSFAVYHCTATHTGGGCVDIAFKRLIGGDEKHYYSMPASRQVHLAADPDRNTLVIVESGSVRISLRPPAAAVVEWFAALRNTPDSSVFISQCRQPKPSPMRSWSQSTASSEDEDRPSYFKLRFLFRRRGDDADGVKKACVRSMRVYSLDDALQSRSATASISEEPGLLYKTSSEPELFAEEGEGWNRRDEGGYNFNASTSPSVDDLAPVFDLRSASPLSVNA